MRVAVDVMGGDGGPSVVIRGAVLAAKKYKVKSILVGDTRVIEDELRKYPKLPPGTFEIYHADEVITMDDQPAKVLRGKRNSSVHVGLTLVKEGLASGFYSAGNTGAVMACSLMILRRISGIDRPAIATMLPTMIGESLILDLGANVDCKPLNLLQFGVMGSVYFSLLKGVENPTVGLLNIGEEAVKGNDLTKRSHVMLSELGKEGAINFVGNVEAKQFYLDGADVVVCDGFTGNITLKITESVGKMAMSSIKGQIKYDPLAWIGALFMFRALRSFSKKADYHQYGGAPFLGVNGISIIGHGSANAFAIANGIKMCEHLSKKDIIGKLNAEVSESVDYLNDLNTMDTAPSI